MQTSIRTSIAALSLIALCIAGWVSGPPVAWLGTAVLFLLFVAYAINAAVGPTETRVFAIGLLIPALTYLMLTALVSDREYGTSGGRLPTTQLFQSFVEAKLSGKSTNVIKFDEMLRSARETLPLFHLSIALVFGYAGALYARWITRKNRGQ